MIPQSLAAAQANLLAAPRPVIFLDTCDVVNLLQVVTTAPVSELKAVNRLLAALTVSPQRCQPVGTWVTAVEYPQKTDATNPVYQKDSVHTRLPPAAVTERITEIDAQIQRLHLIRQELGQPLPAPAIVYGNLNILDDLRATASLLLDLCWEIQQDQACVNAAIARVFMKDRPSHKKEVKDSIHLEHCLALATGLRNTGFAEPILFTSANKNDYGPAVGHQPHPELQAAFAGVQMAYFEQLSRAIAHLGV